MPYAQKLLLATVFRSEPPATWPDTVWRDPDKALVMNFVRELVA